MALWRRVALLGARLTGKRICRHDDQDTRTSSASFYLKPSHPRQDRAQVAVGLREIRSLARAHPTGLCSCSKRAKKDGLG